MSHTFVNKPRTAQVKVQTRLNSDSEVNSTNRSRNGSNASTDVSSLGTTSRKTTLPATSKPQSTVNQKGQHVQKLNAVQQKSPTKAQSYGAFTVIPPDQKKRNELQKKAEAELTALEDLKKRRSTGHVSITPSTVGGSLTMEEVRRKQQEEMKMAKSRLKSNKPGTSSAAQE
ncbi:hypothetical protein AOXY_G9422 [Acipenser oxyrinchus oxyrinchus]|uniref:Uncharacterized protein n=1 Tax=Acipenser oxyrinchus oxyrinchus TaxID=40147 RepID=A0AAD8DGK0_ACIOX|nr:hypothetical protein AOXY_G9422 [Acipenser oxyrinchus oxyrinchus]